MGDDALTSREDADHWFGDPRYEGSEHPDAGVEDAEGGVEVDFSPTCPDCGTLVGYPHHDGCDVERCSSCKRQRLGCDCPDHDPSLTMWTGEWPGIAECRELGWYARLETGRGWVSCAPDAPGAHEDLNRWILDQIKRARAHDNEGA